MRLNVFLNSYGVRREVGLLSKKNDGLEKHGRSE